MQNYKHPFAWTDAKPTGMSPHMPDEQVDKALVLPITMDRNISMYTFEVNNIYLSLSVMISVALKSNSRGEWWLVFNQMFGKKLSSAPL